MDSDYPANNPDSNDEINAQKKASALFLKHYELVCAVAFRVAPMPWLREDIVQDTYIEFVKDASRLDLDMDVVPLLKSITRNVGRQHWRRYVKNLPSSLQKIAERLEGEFERREIDADPFSSSLTDEQLAALDLCLKRLTDRSRFLLESHYDQGIPLVELAKTLGSAANTIHQTLSRIRAFLRKCINSTLQVGGFHAK